MSRKAISNGLWTYRKKKGLSQKRVAFLLGHKTTSQLSNYERGRKLPGLINALKLEIICEMPVGFLFHELYHSLKEDIKAKEEKLRRILGEA